MGCHARSTSGSRPAGHATRTWEDAHSSPVATLLSQLKTAQASWAQEKVDGKRDSRCWCTWLKHSNSIYEQLYQY
jgi:hypothetical protein